MTESSTGMAVIGLGVLSLITFGFMVLALMDIGQGIEPDLSTEWAVVRVALVTSLVFHAVALRVLWKKRSTGGPGA